VNFGNLQDIEEEDFEQQLVRNPGKCSLTMLILYVSPSSYTFACIVLNTYTLYNYRIGFMISIFA
jgi:hypothetical protein